MFIRALTLAAPLAMIVPGPYAIDAGPPASTTPASRITIHRTPPQSPGLPRNTVAEGTFQPYRTGATAITYDPAVVPAGASARLTITNLPYGTRVRLTAARLVPNRAYGVHLHTNACTADPAGAGPHYQHHRDPAAVASPPSIDPNYANPRNEIWLDFTADATGAGAAQVTHGWDFDPADPPRSLVVHAEQTRTAPGVAGTAGPRAACLTLPLG